MRTDIQTDGRTKGGREDMLYIGRITRHRHRHPRKDPREDVGVDVGVVECGLNCTVIT